MNCNCSNPPTIFSIKYLLFLCEGIINRIRDTRTIDYAIPVQYKGIIIFETIMAIEIVKFSNVLVYWAITDDLKVFDLIF